MHLDGWTIALQAVNFGILVWLLHRFLYRPVLKLVDARKAEIQRQYDDAKAAEDTAKAQLASIEAERAGIAAEREAAIQAGTAQARQAAEALRAQAERDAQAVLDDGRKTLAAERSRALDEAQRMAIDLGSRFARRLLDQVPAQLRAEAWIGHVEDHLKSLPRPEIDALVRQLVDGAALIVVTASPPPPPVIDVWRDRLRRILGDQANIQFEVNADLIAGAELRFPTAVLSFSWQTSLAALRSEIGLHADAR